MRRNAVIKWLWSALVLLTAVDAHAVTHKFAVVLGNNLGHDPAKELKYAEQDATKMRDVLVELGGFRPDDVKLVLDGDSNRAWAAIERMEQRLSKRKSETGAKSLLLFFYSGHADGDVLELGESSLRFEKLLDYLRLSSADVRLAFLDSCQSGRLIAAKGGRRGPEYNINLTDEITSMGFAIVTSSSQNELSQESAEIRGAFFTHYLVSALRGAGDKSGDGKVTLNEAYQYAYARTLARTSAAIGVTQHPMYEFQLQGRGEIILTNTDLTGTRIAVRVPESGRLLLLDESENEIVAEADINADERAVLAVRPGSYRAYLLAGGDAVRFAEVNVRRAARADLSADDFQTVELKTAVPKGGLFIESEPGWTQRFGGGGVWRKWPLEDAISSYGASVHYRLEKPSGFEPGLRVTWTTRQDVGLSTGYNDVGVSLGPGYAISILSFVFRAELLVGYEQLIQDEREGEKRTTPGFDYGLLIGAELPLTRMLYASLDAAGGGRIFDVVDKGVVHRFDFQAVLSLGLKWID
jgi:hypothetical protein